MTTSEFYDEVETSLDELAEISSDGNSEASDNEDAEFNSDLIGPNLYDIEVEDVSDINDEFDSDDNVPVSTLIAKNTISWSRKKEVVLGKLPDFNSYSGLLDFIKDICDSTHYKLFELFFFYKLLSGPSCFPHKFVFATKNF